MITSSFAAINDREKGLRPGYVYSEKDWNPVSPEEAVKSATVGYAASKAFAERAAWDFVKEEKPNFELTTVCSRLVLFPKGGISPGTDLTTFSA